MPDHPSSASERVSTDESVTTDQPLISVVIPYYQGESTIERTFLSLEQQNYKNFEVILIDDCSPKPFADHLDVSKFSFPTQIIRLNKNIGPGPARNQGIKSARGRFLALLDADDLWLPDKLTAQLNHHLSTKSAISCTGYFFGDAAILVPPRITRTLLLRNNVINTSTTMFDLEQIQPEFSSQRLAEDYSEWLKLTLTCEISGVQGLHVRRPLREGISGNKLEMAKMRWRVYREQAGLSLPRAFFYFLLYASSGLSKYFNVTIRR